MIATLTTATLPTSPVPGAAIAPSAGLAPTTGASPQQPPHNPARAGFIYGLIAYLAWGLAPMYFKQLTHVAPLRVVSHRIIWSTVFLTLILTFGRKWSDVRSAVRSRRTLLTLVVSAALIAGNWLIFIWAITAGHLLQASLGYFINPLVNVLLGVVLLGERLRLAQILGVALAAAGVVRLTLAGGEVPWVALSLAVTFAIYGLLRKVAHVGALVGLSVETALLLPLALACVLGPWAPGAGADASAAGASDPRTMALLVTAGLVTILPLLCFAASARRLRLTTLGFLQYLAPTCQFLLAVFLYDEPFSRDSLVSFSLIWAALLVYSADSVYLLRRRPAPKSEVEKESQCTDFT